MKVECVWRSSNLYPFILIGYPMNAHDLAQGSNFDMDLVRVDAKHRQPNTLRWW